MRYFEIYAIYVSGHVAHRNVEAQNEDQALAIVKNSSKKVVSALTSRTYFETLVAQRSAIVASFGVKPR